MSRNPHAPHLINGVGRVARDDPDQPGRYPRGGGPIRRADIEYLRDVLIDLADSNKLGREGRQLCLWHANDLHWLLSGGRIAP